MSETVLLLVHTEADGSLPKAALEATGAAKALAEGLGGTLIVGLIGESVDDAANQIAGCGATRFLGVAGADFAQARYATDAAAAEALAKASGATVIIAPGTSRLSRVLSGVSHRLGGRIDTHATAIEADGGAPKIARWYYRQRMVAEMSRKQRPWTITVDPGSLAPWEGEPGSAAVEAVAADAAEKRTEVTGVQAPPADEQTIRPEAEMLFVAGAGWTKKQADGDAHVDSAGELILVFLKESQASLGSSKSLVDLSGEGQEVFSFMTHLNQVGQTGATPRHSKGLATCCHGEEPHVVGWRFINERRAVNLDANCGWAQGKTDVLYVADAFAVVEKVNALLRG
jgi:electron transfer flavoprotein alpha subunit